jgi:hypothetical protein
MSEMNSETPAPGTGETPAGSQPGSSAETQNTGQPGGGTTETVPYSRFKEVNDRLGPYRELEGYGYDADSLRRLVGFEASFVRDPQGTMAALADSVEGLSDEAKAEIKRHLGVQDSPNDGGTPQPTGQPAATGQDEPPPWAKPLVEDYQSRQMQGEMQQREAVLDSIIEHWEVADKAAGVETPMETKLAYISANARNGVTPEQVAQAARQDFMSLRESILSSAVQNIGQGSGAPRPVPGGGVATGGGVPLKNLKDASAAVLQAAREGKLPGYSAEGGA